MNIDIKKSEAVSAEPLNGRDIPLERHIAELEEDISRMNDRINLEFGQMAELFELLLRQNNTWLEITRRRRTTLPYAGGSGAGESSSRRRSQITAWPRRDASPGDEDKAPDAEPPRADEVGRLHEKLRAMTTREVDSPSNFSSAPGYYAVYFTDEPDGIELEYVHGRGRR